LKLSHHTDLGAKKIFIVDDSGDTTTKKSGRAGAAAPHPTHPK